MERLNPRTSVLVVVDVQERLAAAMPADAMERLIANAGILLDAARILRVPVLVSQQYTKGLGPTVAAIAQKLAAGEGGAGEASDAARVQRIEKLAFDACGESKFSQALGALAPRAVVLVGMETHVCVFQTARELVRRGYQTHVVIDAVASRREENRVAGIALCERAGAVPTVTETVVFDWLERAGTEEFRQVSKLVR